VLVWPTLRDFFTSGRMIRITFCGRSFHCPLIRG
jgi:hypothetical protein